MIKLMIFQDNIIGSIIGSAIATIFSILVWVIIEILKKWNERHTLKKNIRKLYKQLTKEESEPYIAIDVADLIDQISKEKILKLLRFDLQEHEPGYVLINDIFVVKVLYKQGTNIIEIDERKKNMPYQYENPTKNVETKKSFLEYYKEQCDKEKIKIK